MTVVGGTDDFPHLLHVGMPVLQQMLGSRSEGLQHFTVTEDREGSLEIADHDPCACPSACGAAGRSASPTGQLPCQGCRPS